jgi:hypothetical protein
VFIAECQRISLAGQPFPQAKTLHAAGHADKGAELRIHHLVFDALRVDRMATFAEVTTSTEPQVSGAPAVPGQVYRHDFCSCSAILPMDMVGSQPPPSAPD